MSGRMWEAVEACTRKVGMGEAERRRSERGSRKKEREKREEKETKKGKIVEVRKVVEKWEI